MPIDNVKSINVNDNNFCVRNLSKKLMNLAIPPPAAGTLAVPRSRYSNRCAGGHGGFNSAGRISARDECRTHDGWPRAIRAAPRSGMRVGQSALVRCTADPMPESKKPAR
jgi:hypothetical protein